MRRKQTRNITLVGAYIYKIIKTKNGMEVWIHVIYRNGNFFCGNNQ